MKKFLPLIPLVFIILCLEFCSRFGFLPAYLFPAPSQVFSALVESRSEFTQAFLQTERHH